MPRRALTPLGLLVRTEKTPEYFHITASIVTLDGTKVRNPSGGAFTDPLNGYAYLADLQVRSQGSNDHREKGLYAFDVEYRDVFSIDHAKAVKMVQTLTLLERRMKKMRDARGYVKTFGEYMGRVAEAIGATQFLHTDDSRSSSYDDMTFSFYTLASGIERVDAMEAEWKGVEKNVAAPVES